MPLYERASKVKKIDEQAERECRAEDMALAAKSEAKFFAGQSDQRSFTFAPMEQE